MPWGFFSLTHILSLLFIPIFTVGMYFLLKGKSEKIQKMVMFPISLLGITSMIFNVIYYKVTEGESPLENLPLHLCSFNAIVLPIVILTKNKTLGNVLFVWCLGAVAALFLNNEMCGYPFFSWPIFFYYWPHVVEFAFPILLVSLKLIEKDPKCILSSVAITMALYTVVHFMNLALNQYIAANNILNTQGELILANYMYSLAPNNPLVAWFMELIPGGYWHMYLAVPILVVYLLIVYLPDMLRSRKKKQCV